MMAQNRLKFPLEIGDYLTITSEGNQIPDNAIHTSVCKVVGEATLFNQKAYVCSNGGLITPLNSNEDGLYCDARLGTLGPWYAVPDEKDLSIAESTYTGDLITNSEA